MLDVATQEGSNFAYQFEKRYDIEPDWIAAGYYDAAFLVTTVLERSGANFSNKNPWERRVSVQKGLTEFYDYQSSCRGVNGLSSLPQRVILPFPGPLALIITRELFRRPISIRRLTLVSTVKNCLRKF